MRRAVATLVLLGLLAPTLTRGEEALVFVAPRMPPAKAIDLTWRYGGRDEPGVWLTAQQETTLGTRLISYKQGMDMALDQNARCEVALAEARGSAKVQGVPWWVWVVGGAAAGVVSVLAIKGAVQ